MNDGMNLSAADVAAVTRNNDGGFGGDWGSWIIILLVLAVFGGWGGAGFGGFGGGGGAQGFATRADINAGFALNNLDNGIRGIQQGLCDGFYAQNTTMLQGFNGVQGQIANLGYQMQNCCCETQRAIDGVNYNMANQFCGLQNTINNSTRDIIDSQNAGTRAVLDFLTQDKIATLTAENQALKFQASQTAQNAFITANQEAQTAELIRRLGADCPVPAYVVQPPTQVSFPVNSCGVFNGYNGYGNGCGCG